MQKGNQKMTNLSINTNITSSEIEVEDLITSNNMSSYFFISGSIVAELYVDSYKHEITLQTGHSYYHNDYSLPSNSLSIYESTAFIEKLNEYCETELDNDSVIEEINEAEETSYSKEEMIDIYLALNELIDEAQMKINEAEKESEEELDNDTKTYVLVTEKEKVETYDDQYEIRQFQENYSKAFNTEEEAEQFIRSKEEDNNCFDYARIVDKEVGIDNLHEFLS